MVYNSRLAYKSMAKNPIKDPNTVRFDAFVHFLTPSVRPNMAAAASPVPTVMRPRCGSRYLQGID